MQVKFLIGDIVNMISSDHENKTKVFGESQTARFESVRRPWGHHSLILL